MTKFFLSLLLTGFLLLCFSQGQGDHDHLSQIKDFHKAENIFQEAEQLSLNANDNEKLLAAADEVYAMALQSFRKLGVSVEKAGNDSLTFFIRSRTGLISYYLGELDAAKKDYLETISIQQKHPAIPDTLLFIPFLYTGSIYYSQSQFDSALNYYKKAELVNDKYKIPLAGSERLFNRLGVIYYENGNYKKARNYFEKAITLTNPSDTGLVINYMMNVASLLIKLEDYPNAKIAYESLLSYRVFPDEINHNLGIINLRLKDHIKAISFLKKVNYNDNKKIIDLYYNFGEAWAGIQERDSSEFYLQKAIAENTKWNGHKKNIPFGLILNFQAGEMAKQQNLNQAIELYQQAIMQFDASFIEKDVYKNPEEFSTVFSYFNLFNTLVAKADALDLLYQEKKDIKFLEYSLDTYRSAYKLAEFVEKTFDSDESRLFLGKIKYTAHNKPIDVCLLLYDLTEKKEYLEKAYYFDQQNKASVLTLNVRENELKSDKSISNILSDKETSMKTSISRLTLKSSQLTDSLQLQTAFSSIRDYEIQLGKLQQKMMEDPNYRSRYFSSLVPEVKDLQKKLDNTTALLSFHLSENQIITFIITGKEFSYNKSTYSSEFIKNLDSLKSSLYNTSPEQRYNSVMISTALYSSIMAPLESKLKNIERLIIIPDDELSYLPFEALTDEKGKYLVERFSIQYQYSTALLGNNSYKKKAKGTLAFAPFTSRGYSDSAGNRFSVLPASREEIVNLEGKIYSDSNALKSNFLASLNQYGIIHLATHASVNNETPILSFIAFYPTLEKSPDDFKLFASEIYNLKLDSVELIILSACETGAGKLVKGEGLMSLSRAFAYAGCPNIITSLWKAEDKSTAYITQKLHDYIKKGNSKDIALQKAKLDFLKSTEVDPRLKSPNYWAHLVFIGNYEAKHHSSDWWWIAGVIILTALIFLLRKRKNFSQWMKPRQIHPLN